MLKQLALSAPLFGIVGLGYALALLPLWRKRWTDVASRFVFGVAIPALLFRMMARRGELPPIDERLLLAFFGGCLIVFGLGRLLAAKAFRLDGVAQSVFGMGGIFSNNVLLGIPLAQAFLGPAALAAIALVLLFNTIVLWMIVSFSVAWATHGALSWRGLGGVVGKVLRNPIILSILAGAAWSFVAGEALPEPLSTALAWLSGVAGPCALLVLGMGLAQHAALSQWRLSATMSAVKLCVQPLVVWVLCAALALPELETAAVVLLGAMPVGVNVYLMALQFDALKGAVAGSLVLSTLVASLTAPVFISLVAPRAGDAATDGSLTAGVEGAERGGLDSPAQAARQSARPRASPGGRAASHREPPRDRAP